MCQKKDFYIFCTCLEDKIDSDKVELMNNYSWNLRKYLGEKESSIASIGGKIVRPKNDLGDGITLKNIINQLNENIKSFDINYIPTDRDCLKISVTHPTEIIRCFKIIYSEGKWIEGSNPYFGSLTEIIAEGNIKRKCRN